MNDEAVYSKISTPFVWLFIYVSQLLEEKHCVGPLRLMPSLRRSKWFLHMDGSFLKEDALLGGLFQSPLPLRSAGGAATITSR
jgi:hypothetical protein